MLQGGKIKLQSNLRKPYNSKGSDKKQLKQITK